MGYDIIIKFPINQDDIEDFVCKNKIDKNDSNQKGMIIDYYKKQNPNMAEINLCYYWSQSEYMHVFFDYYGTNFLRNDKRFTEKALQQQLAEKYGRDFPKCLINLSYQYQFNTSEDAVEIAEALMLFFNDIDDDDDDDNNFRLICFAKWLLRTSKINGATYELSR